MEEKSRKIAGILGEPDEIERKDSIDILLKKLNQYFGTDPGDLRQTGDQGAKRQTVFFYIIPAQSVPPCALTET